MAVVKMMGIKVDLGLGLNLLFSSCVTMVFIQCSHLSNDDTDTALRMR